MDLFNKMYKQDKLWELFNKMYKQDQLWEYVYNAYNVSGHFRSFTSQNACPKEYTVMLYSAHQVS